MLFPLSAKARFDLFYEVQNAPETLKSKRAKIQGKDPATELLLDLLSEDYESIFPRFQTYLAQNPTDSEWLNEAIPFLLNKKPELVPQWLSVSPETPLSDAVVRMLFKRHSSLNLTPTIQVGFLRKQTALFLQQNLWLQLLRYQIPAQIFVSSLETFRSMKDPQHPFYQEPLNFLWIALNPEDILPRSEWEKAPERVLALFISWVESALNYTSADILLSTFFPPLLPKLFVSGSLFQQYQYLNYAIFQHFGNHSRVSILDTEQLLRTQGEKNALDPFRLFYTLAPESSSFSTILSRWATEWIRQNRGQIRKCIVLDLDGTLWGGSLDEDRVLIGPEYPGNVYYHFQQALKTFSQSGILLAINSKNDKTQVLQAIQNHSMPLKIEHFASIEADWQDKTEKMKRLQQTLHLSLESFLFLDNDPRERFLMRQSLPQILTPELPAEALYYTEFLYSIPELARFKLTDEDRQRTQSYHQETRRKEFALSCETQAHFFASLGLKLSLKLAENQDFERLAQLSKRTNQFHFTGHRLTEAELLEQHQHPQIQLWRVSAVDHFGEYGDVGLLKTRKATHIRVEEFFLSCRILGRGVEKALLNWIAEAFPNHPIWLLFQKTERNAQAQDFLQQLKTCPAPEDGFLEVLEIPPCPEWIQRIS